MYFARLDDSPMFRTQVSRVDLVLWDVRVACVLREFHVYAIGSSALLRTGRGNACSIFDLIELLEWCSPSCFFFFQFLMNARGKLFSYP